MGTGDFFVNGLIQCFKDECVTQGALLFANYTHFYAQILLLDPKQFVPEIYMAWTEPINQIVGSSGKIPGDLVPGSCAIGVQRAPGFI